ncbi:MAG: hypothetical protein JST75_02080 [Bacteroidetes bacterium]|nr:hypothetical protein [Bacteroidota bacterium]
MTTMQQQYRNKTDQKDDCGCSDCKDKDNATQVSINTVRATLCSLLYDSQGTVAKLETKFTGESEVYQEKRCIFLHTESNYRRYRNFEICTGTELIQTNDSVKATVAQLKDWNKSLNTTLTNLFKQIKDLKTKFTDLKDAAGKLDTAYGDKCNNGQKKALTGKSSENCDDQKQPIDACKDADTEIKQLICVPKGLWKDIDSIFQSSSDVIGIQIFSNIDALDQMQKDLSTKSSAFDKQISDTMKTRKTELDKLQDDLVTSVKTITQVAIDRNTQRANFEGYYDTTDFLCCPTCSCVPKDDTNNNQDSSNNYKSGNTQNTKDCNDGCPPRLKNCEQEICDICEEVQKTYCCDADNPNPTKPTPPPIKKGCD